MDTTLQFDNGSVDIRTISDNAKRTILSLSQADARSLWIVLTYLDRLDYPWPCQGHIGNRLRFDDFDYPEETPFYHSLEEYQDVVPESETDTAYIGRGDYLYVMRGGPHALIERSADVPWNLIKNVPVDPCNFRIRREHIEMVFDSLDTQVERLFEPQTVGAVDD